MKVILLNGPPRSGKDYAAIVLNKHWEKSKIFWFATHVKSRSQRAILDFDGREDITLFEDCKDTPSQFLFDKTPREVWIAFSEKFMKPLFGKDIFGKYLALDLLPHVHTTDIAIVADSGFKEEAKIIIELIGHKNIFHIKLSRDGCDFNKDSRGYIDLSDLNVKSTKIHNQGDEFFANEIIQEVERFLGE